MGETTERRNSAALPILRAGNFSYALGRGSPGGYGASPLKRADWLNTGFHRSITALVLNNRPRGFLRVARVPSRRFVHKVLHTVFAKNSLSRLLNFATYLRERHRKACVQYMPPLIFVDPSSACNLRCPGCATGLDLSRRRSIATLGMMRAVVDQVCRSAIQIAFYHLGEPFFNDDLFDAIRYARENGLWTVVNSHLSLSRPSLAAKVVNSGLHDLLVSCDGASPEAYERYRRGGSLELVMANLRNIRECRDRLGRRTPFIRVKMIVFEHNWHEALLLRKLALSHGADEVQYVAGNGPESLTGAGVACGTQFDVMDLSWKEKLPTGSCQEIWLGMYLTPDGGALSCCLGHRDEDLFVRPGTALDIRAMWNAAPYVAARRFFLGELPAGRTPSICQSCGYVRNFKQS